MRNLRGNLRRYQVFSALAHTPFMLPVIVLFWKENSLDLLDIYLLQGIFALAMVLLEVPTGMVADRLGKRASLVASTALMCAGFLIYTAGSSFGIFLAAELVLAVGGSLLSGADSALLYDTLRQLGRHDEYARIEGKARAIQMVSFAVCNVVGGLVGSLSYRVTVGMTGIGPLVAFFVAMGFVEARRFPDSDSNAASDKAPPLAHGSYRTLINDSMRFVRRHRLVRWHIVFLAILSGSSTWLLWLYQPYMKWTGLPVFAFGFAFAFFNLFSAAMSKLAHRFDETFGRTGALIVLMILQIAPLPLMALFVTPASFLFILGHQAVRGIMRIVISDRILRYTYADKRATVLSLGSMFGRLFFALSAPFVGLVANRYDMTTNLLVQGSLLFILMGILLVLYHRIPAKYFVVKGSVQIEQ